MIQVKEFLFSNYQSKQEEHVNEWLRNNPNIKIIDIKSIKSNKKKPIKRHK